MGGGTVCKEATTLVTPPESTSMSDLNERESAEEEATDDSVLSSSPSKAEVEEALSDLQGALRLGLELPTSDRSANWSSGSSSFAKVGEIADVCPPSEEDGDESFSPNSSKRGIDRIEPPPISTALNAFQGSEGNVVEALHQLLHNPEVKRMAKSLANDPAIWKAFISNKEVQEYVRSNQGEKSETVRINKEMQENVPSKQREKGFSASRNFAVDFSKDHSDTEERPQNFFSYLQDKLQRLLKLILNIARDFFKTVKQAFYPDKDWNFADFSMKSSTMSAAEDGDSVYSTLKATLMSSVAVLLVVILNRIIRLGIMNVHGEKL